MGAATRSREAVRPPPPLVGGDRLTRVEFERRYDAAPGVKKAELVDGVVYVGSPLRKDHGRLDGLVAGLLTLYAAKTPGAELLSNVTVRLDEDNDAQPDQVLCLLPAAGGRTHEDQDGYVAGGPELVVEVALSSASYDLHQKRDVYRRHGVQEYVVVVLEPPALRGFRSDAGRFVDWRPDRDGVLRSRVFPGLWLDARALLACDAAGALATLERGLASKEHATFRRALGARLARAGKRPRPPRRPRRGRGRGR